MVVAVLESVRAVIGMEEDLELHVNLITGKEVGVMEWVLALLALLIALIVTETGTATLSGVGALGTGTGTVMDSTGTEAAALVIAKGTEIARDTVIVIVETVIAMAMATALAMVSVKKKTTGNAFPAVMMALHQNHQVCKLDVFGSSLRCINWYSKATLMTTLNAPVTLSHFLMLFMISFFRTKGTSKA